MPFLTITKPAQGKATWKSLIDAVIDNLTYLFSQTQASALIANGSFEDDGDGDGEPDGWAITLYTGGTFLLDNTDQQHGDYSAKFTSPGGASNGGGFMVSEDFFAVSPNRRVEVLWEMKSSAAGVNNRVEILWYKADETASTTTSTSLYNSTANPTSWTAHAGAATPPSDARYAKLRITGAHNSSATAGNVRFDNVQVRMQDAVIPAVEVISASGTWTVPNGVTRVQIEAWGGGGGGKDSAGRGGGGGEYGMVVADVTPQTAYTATIGAGGSGGAAPQAGGTTSLGALISVAGGAAGSAGSPGTGGSGSSATLQINGGTAGGNSESSGGDSPNGGAGGSYGANGIVPGGGGGGNSGSGAAGRIVLRY